MALFLFSCDEEVSTQALNAGFKTDQDYEIHLEKLAQERDSGLLEKILYTTNLKNLNDDQYALAIKNLSKEYRKYISQGGTNINLLVASKTLLDLKDEFDDVVESGEEAYDEALGCLADIDTDYSDYTESQKTIIEAGNEIKKLLCQLKLYERQTLSESFLNAHNGARALANHEETFQTCLEFCWG